MNRGLKLTNMKEDFYDLYLKIVNYLPEPNNLGR